jgi:hypothetical protein
MPLNADYSDIGNNDPGREKKSLFWLDKTFLENNTAAVIHN